MNRVQAVVQRVSALGDVASRALVRMSGVMARAGRLAPRVSRLGIVDPNVRGWLARLVYALHPDECRGA
jgi:hypothetical protein